MMSFLNWGIPVMVTTPAFPLGVDGRFFSYSGNTQYDSPTNTSNVNEDCGFGGIKNFRQRLFLFG